MSHSRLMTLGGALVLLLFGRTSLHAGPPTCTTHFFDWYEVSEKSPRDALQKHWTYRVDWGALGITPEEIGRSVHYYEVQFRKIREAGFDGLHYEWHANRPKPQFVEALRKASLPAAMFYDMEIRFSGRPEFITPTESFAREFVGDVLSFYRAVPRDLWLHDRNGRLPIVVYGYAFDRKVADPAPWDQFYRAIIQGVEQALGERVVFHWTNSGAMQQMYGFQHFPQIQSYIFNEASPQDPTGAHSVTFVVHYDDLGPSFLRQGERSARWIRNDIRYLQEDLWLAKHTNPDLVFNYGWNELFEGEHLLPDSLWGTWRYELAAAIVKDIKAHARADLPRVLAIADDFLPALRSADPATTSLLLRELRMLGLLRSVLPQVEVVLSGHIADLTPYAAVFAMNTLKSPREESVLERCGRPVVYANPLLTSATPLAARFTAAPRKPLNDPSLGPANEYVALSRKVDVDLGRFPLVRYRFRNSPGTVFHIRYYGLDRQGNEVQAWYEGGPTEHLATRGQWHADQANVAEVTSHVLKEPLSRLSRIEVILDDMEDNGTFTLDMDYLRFTSTAGEVGLSVALDPRQDWTVHSDFEHIPGASQRFGFTTVEAEGRLIPRITLTAVVSEKVVPPVDESTCRIDPRDGVERLVEVSVEGNRVPVLLARDGAYWLNTYTPTDACWEALIPRLMKAELNKGVIFRNTSHSVSAGGVTSATNEGVTIIRDEPLPINRVRLVAPPELGQPLPHALPVSLRQPSLRVVQGARSSIPLPDARGGRATIILEPGEVVDLLYP